jgi:hypothetical protein
MVLSGYPGYAAGQPNSFVFVKSCSKSNAWPDILGMLRELETGL